MADVGGRGGALSRRRFLQIIGASLALAGLDGCLRQPPEAIVPYAHAPEGIVPGRPLVFATEVRHDGYVTGVLARTNEGTGIFEQASLLTLYDPERSPVVLDRGNVSTWSRFVRR